MYKSRKLISYLALAALSIHGVSAKIMSDLPTTVIEEDVLTLSGKKLDTSANPLTVVIKTVDGSSTTLNPKVIGKNRVSVQMPSVSTDTKVLVQISGGNIPSSSPEQFVVLIIDRPNIAGLDTQGDGSVALPDSASSDFHAGSADTAETVTAGIQSSITALPVLSSIGTPTTTTTVKGNLVVTGFISGNATSATTANQAATANNFTGSLSGDVTGTQGATSINAATVVGKSLTGFSASAGTITASDSILSAFNKSVANLALTDASLVSVNGKLLTATNGLSSVNGKLATTTSGLASVNGRLLTAESTVASHTTTLSSQATTLSSHTSSLTSQASSIATNASNIATNTSNIATNTTNIAANTSSITSVNGKLALADASIVSVNGKLLTTTNGLSSVNGKLATTTSGLASVNGRLLTAESTVASHTSSISTNTANISALSSSVSTLNGTVASQTAAIAGKQNADADLDTWATKTAPSGTVVGTTDSQALTNKLLQDSTVSFADNSDITKVLKFEVSGITTGTTRIVTVPDASGTMTLLGNSASGTGDIVLANSPALVTPSLGVATATSVNKVAITQPATAATLALANNSSLNTVGAYAVTLNATNTTSVTLPVSGTLATTGDLTAKQDYDAGLTSIAALSTSADKMIYTTGSDTYSTTNVTALARTNLGMGTATNVETTGSYDATGIGFVSFVDNSSTTNDITSISGGVAGQRLLILIGTTANIVKIVDGGNLMLSAANFNATVGCTLELVSDGTNWYEISRSSN